jgi:hypothetical protein
MDLREQAAHGVAETLRTTRGANHERILRRFIHFAGFGKSRVASVPTILDYKHSTNAEYQKNREGHERPLRMSQIAYGQMRRRRRCREQAVWISVDRCGFIEPRAGARDEAFQ